MRLPRKHAHTNAPGAYLSIDTGDHVTDVFSGALRRLLPGVHIAIGFQKGTLKADELSLRKAQQRAVEALLQDVGLSGRTRSRRRYYEHGRRGCRGLRLLRVPRSGGTQGIRARRLSTALSNALERSGVATDRIAVIPSLKDAVDFALRACEEDDVLAVVSGKKFEDTWRQLEEHRQNLKSENIE